MRPRHFLRLGAIALALPLGMGTALANPSILFDLNSGRVIEHQDAFKRWYPASLSKLMTAYVAFRALAAGEVQLDSPIKMTRHSAAEPPSKMGFKAGQVMRLDNALKMMLVKSANDVAMAIGENIGGTQADFAARMNAEAARLGMIGTHFVNPNGLFSPEQYTTARDLAVLVTALRHDFPQYSSWYSIEGLSVGDRKFPNYNLLVGRYAGADGMKTGFVCESGFNMIGSATRDGRTLVAVVLGEKSAITRAEAAARLFGYYLVINGVFAVVSALADAGLSSEDALLARFRLLLERLAARGPGNPACLDYLLNSPTLGSKGNFLFSLRNTNENTEVTDPLAGYVPMSNPLFTRKPA